MHHYCPEVCHTNASFAITFAITDLYRIGTYIMICYSPIFPVKKKKIKKYTRLHTYYRDIVTYWSCLEEINYTENVLNTAVGGGRGKCTRTKIYTDRVIKGSIFHGNP